MIATDLARAILLASIPLLAALGRLRLEDLFVVGPLVGVLTVFFDVAYQSYVPTLVSPGRILEANSKLGISASLAEVTAPGVGALLVAVIGFGIGHLFVVASPARTLDAVPAQLPRTA